MLHTFTRAFEICPIAVVFVLVCGLLALLGFALAAYVTLIDRMACAQRDICDVSDTRTSVCWTIRTSELVALPSTCAGLATVNVRKRS